MKLLATHLALPLVFAIAAVAAPTSHSFQDKTLVVWAAPANLTQQAGSALTIDDGQSHFDGIIFGEITPRKWMPGSDGFRRTLTLFGGLGMEWAGFAGFFGVNNPEVSTTRPVLRRR